MNSKLVIAILMALCTSTSAYSEPASTAADVNADNTKNNVVDAKAKVVNPLDQGNSKADMQCTKDLRKSIMKQKGLSFNAKNVKVITKDNALTLRGVVDSEQEKEVIDSLAKQACGARSLSNLIEVKVKKAKG